LTEQESTQLHLDNIRDAKRAIYYLSLGYSGHSVIRHALESILKRAEIAMRRPGNEENS
jgi:hypothetical protein